MQKPNFTRFGVASAALLFAVVARAGVAFAAPADPSPNPSPAPSPSPGQWVVNGALLTLGGSLSGKLEAGGNTFSAAASAGQGKWNAHYSASGSGPVSLNGSASGPGPQLDATLTVYHVPVTVQGTPGKDLSVKVGLAQPPSAFATDSRPVAAVKPLAGSDPISSIGAQALDWLRGVIAFTLIGWLLILVAPGLRARAVAATRSFSWGSLAVGAVLLLDIPLAALVLFAFGIPAGLWWLGVLALIVYAALAAAGFAYAGFQIGRLIFDRVGWAYVTSFAAVPAGVGILCLLGLVPYVGAFIAFLAMVYGMGSLVFGPRAAAVPVPAAAGTEAVATPGQKAPAPTRPMVE